MSERRRPIKELIAASLVAGGVAFLGRESSKETTSTEPVDVGPGTPVMQRKEYQEKNIPTTTKERVMEDKKESLPSVDLPPAYEAIREALETGFGDLPVMTKDNEGSDFYKKLQIGDYYLTAVPGAGIMLLSRFKGDGYPRQKDGAFGLFVGGKEKKEDTDEAEENSVRVLSVMKYGPEKEEKNVIDLHSDAASIRAMAADLKKFSEYQFSWENGEQEFVEGNINTIDPAELTEYIRQLSDFTNYEGVLPISDAAKQEMHDKMVRARHLLDLIQKADKE